MKYSLTPFLLLFLFSCSPEDSSQDITALKDTSVLGVQPSIPPFQTSALFYENISYDTKSRTQFDLLLPQEKPVAGVVVLFHGGSFLFGGKADFYLDEFSDILSGLLENDIAIVNAEYSFLTEAQSEGVFTPLKDGTQVIDFITKNYIILGIPKDNLLLAGVSAGAGIAFWNGLGKVRPNSIKGILGLQAQSSYDLYKWESLFEDFKVDSLKLVNNELEQLFEQFYGGAYSQEKAKNLDYLNEIEANDPPFYVYNPVFEDKVYQNEVLNLDVLFHSFKHADLLRKKATEVGLPFSGAYQEAPQEFIVRILTQ
ncbi:MAG: alpha/beta hydrolase [Flavobacteriaceae bacterium]